MLYIHIYICKSGSDELIYIKSRYTGDDLRKISELCMDMYINHRDRNKESYSILFVLKVNRYKQFGKKYSLLMMR